MSKSYRLSRPIHPGDPVGFKSYTRLGRWIRWTTLGLLSHIAIAVRDPKTDEVVLFESTQACELPCLILGKRVDGVQCHSIVDRFLAYGDGEFFVHPLVRPLTDEENIKLYAYCSAKAKAGIPYDYFGAFRSRLLGLGWLERWLFPREENLEAEFCSEFVGDCERMIERYNSDNVENWAPSPFIRDMRRQGGCGKAEQVKLILIGE